MIKGVIFDVDGVILDSMLIWKDLGKCYVREQGITPEENLSEILFSMSMEEGAEYLIGKYHLEKTADAILEEIAKLIEHFYFHEVLLKKGVTNLLHFCKEKEIPMIVATSSMREHVEKAFARNEIADYFQEILTTGEIGKSKHDPLIYQLAAKALGEKPEEILVLEDSFYALETAKNAGFHVVGVCDINGEENQEKLALESEAYVEDLSEVILYLETLL